MSQQAANQRAGAATEEAVRKFFEVVGRCEVYTTGKPGVLSVSSHEIRRVVALVEQGKRREAVRSLMAWMARGRRGTMRRPGIYDLYVIQPAHGLTWWWDAKSGGATLTSDQRAFRDHHAKTGALLGHGDIDAARDWLVDYGILAVDEHGVHTYLPPTQSAA